MNKLLVLFILFLGIQSIKATAQDSYCGLTEEEVLYNTYKCVEGLSSNATTINHVAIIKAILEKTGIPNANFKVKPCRGTNNAMALNYKNERFILYDDIYLQLSNKTKNYWYYIFALAHEIGHHLLGHTIFKKVPFLQQQRQQELDADRYAGFICAKLGATENDLKQALLNLPEPVNQYTSSHPSFANRFSYARIGFRDNINAERSILEKYNAVSENQFENYKFKVYIKDGLNAYLDYVKSNSISNKAVAKENFEKAFILKPEPFIAIYLAEIYGSERNFIKAQDYLLKAYAQSKKLYDLLYASSLCEYVGNCSSFIKYDELKNLKVQDLTFDELVLYGSYLGNYNINSSSKNSEILTKSLYVLKFAQNYIKDKNEISFENASLLKEIAKTEAHLGSTDSALQHLEIPYKFFVLGSKEESDEVLRLLIGQSYLSKKWYECYSYAIEYKKKFPNSIDLNSLYYLYIGASALNIGKVEDALTYLNTSIKGNESEGRAYYYRALTYYKLKNTTAACEDLSIACSNFIEDACFRKKIICK